MVVIGRPINGVWINGLEYALDDDGSLRTWESRDTAETFLMVNGETKESIEENYVIEDYVEKND